MSGINELIRIGFFSILIIATLAISSSEEVALYDRYDKPYSNYLFLDKRIQYLMDTKRSVMGIKNLIDDLHNKLEKRTACILDGGLSASCNHKDAVEAGQHHREGVAPEPPQVENLQTFTKDLLAYPLILTPGWNRGRHILARQKGIFEKARQCQYKIDQKYVHHDPFLTAENRVEIVDKTAKSVFKESWKKNWIDNPREGRPLLIEIPVGLNRSS